MLPAPLNKYSLKCFSGRYIEAQDCSDKTHVQAYLAEDVAAAVELLREKVSQFRKNAANEHVTKPFAVGQRDGQIGAADQFLLEIASAFAGLEKEKGKGK